MLVLVLLVLPLPLLPAPADLPGLSSFSLSDVTTVSSNASHTTVDVKLGLTGVLVDCTTKWEGKYGFLNPEGTAVARIAKPGGGKVNSVAEFKSEDFDR